MTTDKELYIIQKEFPDAFVKLSKIKPKGKYKHCSVEVKNIINRSDCIYVSDSPDDPIIFIENQGYNKKNFYLNFNQMVSIYCNQNNYYGDVIKIALFIDKKSYNEAKIPKFNNNFITYILSEMTIDDLKSFNDDILLILSPFCKSSESELLAVYKNWKKDIENKDYSRDSKNNIFGMFSYFFGSIYNKTLKELKRLLGEDIMSSKLAQEIENIGKDKGKMEGKIEIARSMKRKNYPIELIIEITGLTIEEIEKL